MYEKNSASESSLSTAFTCPRTTDSTSRTTEITSLSASLSIVEDGTE